MRRREFIGTTVAVGVGLAAMKSGVATGEEPKPKSVVVKIVRDNAAADKKLNASVVKEMVHAAVCKLSGKSKPEEAWAVYVKKDDTVGIKINCLFGLTASTHPEVTAAVVEGCQMAGVPNDKIIVWDRTAKDLEKCGYTVNKGAGVKCIGVDGDWEADTTAIHTCNGHMAKILTQQCTALINVPILKTHVIAGITCALKNHYGSFDNPSKAHADGCDPFLAHLNNLKCIREKTRLIVCDAILPLPDKGPQAHPELTWEYKAILASTDPVALDYVGLKILDEQRVKTGKPPLESSGKVKCLATAAKMGLGVADMNLIDLVTA
jgi:uncharacterized protein (DUF362 family)